ncbi:hypothetical protein [Rhizobium leguminosarum]|nr:hypothetical protein [Rhizobium leguminosarum]
MKLALATICAAIRGSLLWQASSREVVATSASRRDDAENNAMI